MKKISKKIKVGTKVFVNNVWCEVTEINDTRVVFKTNHWAGSFQAGHIQKFSNKAV